MADERQSPLAQAEERVRACLARYQDANVAWQQAQRDTTLALNELNAAQKDFDDMLQELTEMMPRESDWRSRPVKPQQVKP